jgi:sugar phosphate isomerase/epimerase
VTSRLISLASGVMPDFSPVETAAAAVKSGFPAVGLWVEPPNWTAATTREVRAVLDGSGVAVLDVEVVWIRPGADDPDHFRCIDIGAEVGAHNVLVVSSEPDPGVTAEKFGRLVDHARERGMRACLEFAAFTEVKSLAAALDVLERTARPDAGLLIDPLHFARTGARPSDLTGIPAARFPYAQFCDAPGSGPLPSDVPAIIHEALDLRLMPDEGALPLDELLDVLPAGVPLSVELRSKALRDGYPDATERARALLKATRTMLARHDARVRG